MMKNNLKLFQVDACTSPLYSRSQSLTSDDILDGKDAVAAVLDNWDRQSSCSEISLACLQVRNFRPVFHFLRIFLGYNLFCGFMNFVRNFQRKFFGFFLFYEFFLYFEDRIVQMEETHYSTTEELQATLAELTELQDIVDEMNNEIQATTEQNKVTLLRTSTKKTDSKFLKWQILRNSKCPNKIANFSK